MSNVMISTNMDLHIPTVGTDPGPDWANNLNLCLSSVDAHDHSSHKGVQINPAGININSQLSFNSNDAINLGSARFTPQTSTFANTNHSLIYTVGNSLYYNNSTGFPIQITTGNSVSGASGNITGMTGNASATYVSAGSTFVWQSDVNTAANMDAGSYIFRNLTAGSHGVTVSPPSTLASDYIITLPPLPSSQKIMTLDSSGNMTAPYAVDGTSISIASNFIQVADQGISQRKKSIRSVTTDGSDPGAGGLSISPSCGAFAGTTSATYVTVTNLSCNITTLGNPVTLYLIPDGSSQGVVGGSGAFDGSIAILRGASVIFEFAIGNTAATGVTAIPCSSILAKDVVAAGTYNYVIEMKRLSGGGTVRMQNCMLVAEED